MKLFTQRRILAAALATAFVGLSATAIAQGMGPGAVSEELRAQHMAQHLQAAAPSAPAAEQREARRAQRMERMQQRQTERQNQLKQALQLQPEQEAAWLAFVARTAPQDRPGQRMDRQAKSQQTTPERLDRMQAMSAERHARMSERIEATKSFYAVLSPEQQKQFDAQGLGGLHRASFHGQHGMKGHHGQGGLYRMGGKDAARGQHTPGACDGAARTPRG